MAHAVQNPRHTGGTQQLGAMTVSPDPQAVPHARRQFRRLTAGLGLDCSVDDCTLMLSELVTNAITYGRAEGEWSVHVEWWRDGQALRVDVHNPGDRGNVTMRRSHAADEHGRGLFLVQHLADSWQAGPSPFGGTQVSFVVEDALKATTTSRHSPRVPRLV